MYVSPVISEQNKFYRCILKTFSFYFTSSYLDVKLIQIVSFYIPNMQKYLCKMAAYF